MPQSHTHTHTPSSAHTRQNTHLSLKGKEAALHLCLRALKALNVASLPGLSPALSCAVNTHYDTGNPSSGNTQLSPMLQHSLGNTEEFLFRVPGLSILSMKMFSTVSKTQIHFHLLHARVAKNIFIRMTQRKGGGKKKSDR